MAVVICPAPASQRQHVNERFYKFGTPSPSADQGSPAVYSDLEDSGFHSDEEMQKVSLFISAVQSG